MSFPSSPQSPQENAEKYLHGFLEDANASALHGKRVTVMEKDVELVARLRGDTLLDQNYLKMFPGGKEKILDANVLRGNVGCLDHVW